MTKEEFLVYLEEEKLNPLIILDYLYNKYLQKNKIYGYLPMIDLCREFGFEIFSDDLSEISLTNGGYIYYKNNKKEIIISKSFSYDEQRYLILYLLYKYLENYKYLKDGGEFIANGKLVENYNIIFNIEVLKKHDNKIKKLKKY